MKLVEKNTLLTLSGLALISVTAAYAENDQGFVQLATCGTASSIFQKLQGTDKGMGFGGGNLGAVLVDANNGKAGIAFTPAYNKGKFPVSNFYVTDGTINFKGTGDHVTVAACIGTSNAPIEIKLKSLTISSIGNGWKQAYFTTLNFGVTQRPYTRFSIIQKDTGNITVGDVSLNYGTSNSSGGAQPGTSRPDVASLITADCALVEHCN